MILWVTNLLFLIWVSLNLIPGGWRSLLWLKNKTKPNRKARASSYKWNDALEKKHLCSALRLWEESPSTHNTSSGTSYLVSGVSLCLVTVPCMCLASRSFSASDCYSWYTLFMVASCYVWRESHSVRIGLSAQLNAMKVTLLPMIPFRHISRTWGKVCSLYIPCILRPLVYGIYIKAFGVEMTEAIPSDMRCYKNLGELFRRRIDMKLRPVDSSAQIVSPVDGRVLYSGLLCDGRVEQLKGMSYSVQQLMGPLRDTNPPPSSSTEYVDRMLTSKRNKLFTCTIYLAPGDYHRFHSPVNWTVLHRRHFAGELLSVNPRMLSWFPQLFVTNERVVLSGRWRHGFFSLTAVGATNVGSIVVYHDKMLTTNQPNLKVGSYVDHSYGDGVSFTEGEALGEFRLGSTVVLIYEAPANADIFCRADEIIKCGQKVSCKCW